MCLLTYKSKNDHCFEKLPNNFYCIKWTYKSVLLIFLNGCLLMFIYQVKVVSEHNKYSKPQRANSFMLQGSILGPLLFVIAINLLRLIPTKTVLFADNTTFVNIEKTSEDASQLVKIS